tara:strand:+ start:5424 stop:6461 length:1038 start_codon:yes stop_codon:yes gene_type:complete
MKDDIVQGSGIVLVAGILSWLLGFLVYRALRKFGSWDEPNERSSHSSRIVRGGGVGVLVVILVTAGLAGYFPNGWLGATAIFVVACISARDDLANLGVRVRLLVHFLCVGAIVFQFSMGLPEGSVVVNSLLGLSVFVLLVGYLNAYNFMDGINGIATLQLAMSFIGVITVLFLLNATGDPLFIFACGTVGAAIGFLPHNFPRARLFLGDVGSVSFGLLIGAVALAVWVDYGWRGGLMIVATQLNFLLDTCLTFMRRAMLKQKLTEAHREHFYQRLLRSGKSHVFVTVAEGIIQIVALLVLVIVFKRESALFSCGLVFVMMLWLGFFVYCDSRFRGAEAAAGCDQK